MLNQKAHLLDENDLLENMFLNLPFLSAQVLEKFFICQDLLDGIKECDVDFGLFEDLHHVLYLLSLLLEVGRCLETLYEWNPRLIWYLRSRGR